MLRFYLASAWENKKQVREVAAKLEAAGWKWVYDWTQHREGEERLAAIKEIEAIKIEIRANEHFIAIKAADDGIQCRKEHNGKGSRRGLYIDRLETVRQLVSKGWAVGMSVELHWDEEGQFLWGRKPKGEKAEHGS